MVEVTQADKRRAQEWLGFPADTPARRSEHDRLANKFARHRIAAGRDYERGQIVRFLLQKHTIDQGTAWAAMEIKNGRHRK